MALSHAVSALTQKHAEIQGEIMSVEKQLEQLNEKLNALEVSIHIFEPDFKIKDIAAKRANKKHLELSKGAMSGLVGDYVRLADKDFTANDIIDYVFDSQPQLPESSRYAVRQAVSKMLRRFANRGIIEPVGKGVSQGSPIIWRSVA